MIERSRTPVRLSCRVRGMGVAVRVRTWISLRSCFSRSLWPTPKCCSSSTTNSPRFWKRTDFARTAWVPITISTVPRARPSRVFSASFALTNRDNCRISTGKPRKRSLKLAACWRARSVVGAITATCTPDKAATKAARMATSVLPKPTSPQTSRSMGVPDARSSSVSAMAFNWSSVSW